MFDYYIKDLMDEILIKLDDDEMLIQCLYVVFEVHRELKNLNLVHFGLMVKLFPSVEHDVDRI